jgi:RNA polymerase sigma-70 factor (ECF subfamily)
MSDPLAALPLLLAERRRPLVARLAHALGLAHLALAEDAVQVACLRALERWPVDGVPAKAAAWLYRVAWHHAIDQLRHDGRHEPWPDDDSGELAWPAGCAGEPVAVEPARGRLQGELDDDELALLFAACHPQLPPTTQVALALRALAGLELAAIAPALFCSEAALAQRLARARRLLAGEALAVPAGAELAGRRESVLTALFVMFLSGQQAAGRCTGDPVGGQAAADPGRRAQGLALCWEAIRLARALAAHGASAHADADALAATLVLHGARLSGRFDDAGDIVPLPGQPRDRWDQGLVRLGLRHLQAAQRAERLSRWHLLAGIAAEHATAPDHDRTDWLAVVRWYEWLLRIDPSPAPRLGHAIALAEAGSPRQALALLEQLEPALPAALRAHLRAAQARALQRLGQLEPACRRLDDAIACAPGAADARLLARRRDALRAAAAAS